MSRTTVIRASARVIDERRVALVVFVPISLKPRNSWCVTTLKVSDTWLGRISTRSRWFPDELEDRIGNLFRSDFTLFGYTSPPLHKVVQKVFFDAYTWEYAP